MDELLNRDNPEEIYTDQRVIGAGSYGQVYYARDRFKARDVAIKKMQGKIYLLLSTQTNTCSGFGRSSTRGTAARDFTAKIYQTPEYHRLLRYILLKQPIMAHDGVYGLRVRTRSFFRWERIQILINKQCIGQSTRL